MQEGAHPCGRPHHPLLHGSSSTYCQALATSTATLEQPSSHAFTNSGSIFELQEVPLSSPCGGCTSTGLMMTDTGSTHNFITHRLAAELCLPSTSTTLSIRVLNQGYREQPTRVYTLDLVDREGSRHRVEAVGLESLTEVAPAPEVCGLVQLFPEAPPAAAAAFQRPHGAVSLLLGMRDRRLHAREALEHQNLRLCRTRFSSGWVLTGFASLATSPLAVASTFPLVAPTAPLAATALFASTFLLATSTAPMAVSTAHLAGSTAPGAPLAASSRLDHNFTVRFPSEVGTFCRLDSCSGLSHNRGPPHPLATQDQSRRTSASTSPLATSHAASTSPTASTSPRTTAGPTRRRQPRRKCKTKTHL